MARWGWDVGVRRYRDMETGRFMPGDTVRGFVEKSLTECANVTDRLSGLVVSELSPQDFAGLFRTEIKDEYIRQYLAGIGGVNQMTQRDWGSIGGMLAEQYKHLPGFVADLEAGKLTPEQITARARMYVNSAREGYEKAVKKNAKALGMTEELWVLGEAEHCPSCLDFAAEGWQPMGHFPTPGDGSTQCLCIVSPTSRVLTRRGWLPMWDVRVGDLVWTHQRRWGQVAAVSVKGATGNERLAFVRGPYGEWVGCTDTHLWHTSQGWLPVSGIDTRSELEYHHAQESISGGHDEQELCKLWSANETEQLERLVQGMSLSLQLWGQERLSGGEVYELQLLNQGQGAVGEARNAGDYRGGDSESGQAQTLLSGRPHRRYEVATQAGRTILDLLLGRRHETHDLSLPVGMVEGAWGAPGREGAASFEQGSGRRQARESGTPVQWRASEDTYTRPELGAMGGTAPASVDVRDLWYNLSALLAEAGGRLSQADILLGGLLPRGAALYDLQVAGDHSFCIGGLFAHNTNCACHKEYRGETTGGTE